MTYTHDILRVKPGWSMRQRLGPCNARLQVYVPPAVTSRNSMLFPHSVFICSLWFSQIPLISIYSIFWSAFIMDKGFVLCELGIAVMYINYLNFSLQRFNQRFKSEWPNMPCHFWIQVWEASWFVYLRLAWAGCQIMKPAYGRRCTKNKHFFRVSTNTCSTC